MVESTPPVHATSMAPVARPARVALATMDDLPSHEHDDRPLVAAMQACAGAVDEPSWSDPDYDWAACDAVLLRTTWDYQERLEEFLGWVDRIAAVTRVLNPPAIVRWNVRKRYLRELAAAGIETIPTAWIGLDGEDVIDGNDAPDAPDAAAIAEMARRVAPDAAGYFLKPEVGATAWGTLPIDADEAGFERAAAHVAEWRSHGPMLLQPFLPDVREFGETSIIYVDGSPAHGVRKVPVPGDYRVQDDWGATDGPWEPAAQARDTAARAMGAAAEITGQAPLYGRVDFLRDAGGIFRVVELELVEPSLFLRHGPETAARLAAAVARRAADPASAAD